MSLTYQVVCKTPYRCLSFSSRSRYSGNSKSDWTSDDRGEYSAKPYRIWMLRYTQENSFLSWSRNAAICAGVGATLSVLEGDVPFGNVLGAISSPDYHTPQMKGFLDLGLLFMTVGSVHHIASSFGLRHHMKISWQALAWIVTYTSGIWLLYLGLIKDKLKAQHTTLLGR